MKITIVTYDPITNITHKQQLDLVAYTQWVERGTLQGYKCKSIDTNGTDVVMFTSTRPDQYLVFTARVVEGDRE